MNYDYGYPRQRVQTSQAYGHLPKRPKYAVNDKRSFAKINELSRTAARLKILKPSNNPNKFNFAQPPPVVDQTWSKAPTVGFVSPEELKIKTDQEYRSLDDSASSDTLSFLGFEWYFWAGGALTIFIILFLLVILLYRCMVTSKIDEKKLPQQNAPVRLADIVGENDTNCVSKKGKIPVSEADHFATLMRNSQPIINQSLPQFPGPKSIYSESSYNSKFRNDDSGYSNGCMTLSTRPTPHGSQYVPGPSAMNAQFVTPPTMRSKVQSLHVGCAWPREVRTLRRAQSMAIREPEIYEDVIPNITPTGKNTSHRYNTLPVKKSY